MTRGRVALWRRVLGLVLLACVGLSSMEVAWAEGPAEPVLSADAADRAPTLRQEAPSDSHPASDCACLCSCACASAQQTTAPAARTVSIGAGRLRPQPDPDQGAPLSVVSPPDFRPPIA